MADSKHSAAFSTRRRKRARGPSHWGGPRPRPTKMRILPSYVARSALSKVQKLMRSREVKIHDQGWQSTEIDNGGEIFALADVTQGDTGLLRDGRSMSVFNINLRWKMIFAAADDVTCFRIIVFRDTKQIAGVQPIVLNVLAQAKVVSQLKDIYRTRWDIMYDYTGTVGLSKGRMVVGQFNKRVAIKMEYSGSAASNVTKNGIYLLVISDETTDKPYFERSSRVLFNDF